MAMRNRATPKPPQTRAKRGPGEPSLADDARVVEPVLLGHHGADHLPSLLHRPLASVGGDDADGGVEPPVGARADGLVELGELLGDDDVQALETLLLGGTLPGQPAKGGQRLGELHHGPREWLEVAGVAGDDVAALPGLCVLQEGEDGLRLAPNGQRVTHALGLGLKPGHTIEGQPGETGDDDAGQPEADEAGLPGACSSRWRLRTSASGSPGALRRPRCRAQDSMASAQPRRGRCRDGAAARVAGGATKGLPVE